MSDIATARLVLRLMGREGAAAALEGDLARVAALVDAVVPAELMLRPAGMTYALARFDEDPLYAPWGPRAMLLDGVMIGHVRFHGRPDPAGAVEFGYTVFEPHRGHGYATEAAAGVMGWARREHGVRSFVLTIAPGNAASLAVAARLGFVQVGEQMDEVDGLELVLVTPG